MVLPALAATLAAVGGRALDFSGRALEPGERLLFAGVPVATVIALAAAIGIWRGRSWARLAGGLLGIIIGLFVGWRLVAGIGDGNGLIVQAIGGLALAVVFEILLWWPARGPMPR